jgi:hypothetical protein
LDGRTTLFLAFEGDDPEKMKAMLWHSHFTASHPFLRMENYPLRGWHYPYPRFAPLVQYPALSVDETGPIRKILDSDDILQGSVVELKSYLQDRDSAEDFIPLLYSVAEIHWFNHPQYWLRIRPPVFWAIRLGRDTTILVPSEYALVCDADLESLYSRLGFERVPETPAGADIVMRASRETYIAIAEKMRNRKGFSVVSEDLSGLFGKNAACREALLPRRAALIDGLFKSIARNLRSPIISSGSP